jgi:1,4-dihydroxy-2-naphthoate octaprenyltransferase
VKAANYKEHTVHFQLTYLHYIIPLDYTNMSAAKSDRPSTLKVWILASRPHTLTASISPVIVSYALVQHYSRNHITDPIINIISFMFAAFACFIQLATNLHNDYADFIKGADTDKRVGQARATQKGWLTPFQTAAASTFCILIATCIGIWLTYMTGRWDAYMIFVIVTSAFNAVCYTGGPFPLGYIGLGHLSIGYSGLGDIFVFLYFGLVATVTVPYIYIVRMIHEENVGVIDVFQHELFMASLVVALPIGFLATGIIVVNNLRDRLTDIDVGKNTLAVKFGEAFVRFEYLSLVLGSFLMLVPLAQIPILKGEASGDTNYWLFLPLLALPKARVDLNAMGFRGKDGAALNPHVGGTAKIQLMYSILFAIGLRLQ